MNESSTVGPWLAIAYVFTLVLAGTLNRSSEPVSLRPVEKDTIIEHSLIATRVPARLWEDPIAAGWRAMGSSDPDTNGERLWNLWNNASSILSDRVQAKVSPEEIRRLSWLKERKHFATQLVASLESLTPSIDVRTRYERSTHGLTWTDFLDPNGRVTQEFLQKIEQLAVLKAINNTINDIEKNSISSTNEELNIFNQAANLPTVAFDSKQTTFSILITRLKALDGEIGNLKNDIPKIAHEALARKAASAFSEPKTDNKEEGRPNDNNSNDKKIYNEILEFLGNQPSAENLDTVLNATNLSVDETNYWNKLLKAYKKDEEFKNEWDKEIKHAIISHLDSKFPNKDVNAADNNLAWLLEKVDKNSGNSLIILPIITSGRPYLDDQEARYRSRYAVQEAMEAAGYTPLNNDELNFIPVPLIADAKMRGRVGSIATNKEEASAYVPISFEIFSPDIKKGKKDKHTKKSKVCVLWVDSRVVSLGGAVRYENLDLITTKLLPESKAEIQAISLLGSDNLQKLLATGASPSEKTRIQLIFPKSTAPKWSISQPDKSVAPPSGQAVSGQAVSGQSVKHKIGRFFQSLFNSEKQTKTSDAKAVSANNGWDRRVTRTSPSDALMIQALIEELRRRVPGLEMSTNLPRREIWLLVEQDTLYSRAMIQELEDRVPKSVIVRPFRYLKGIDGNLPQDPKASITSAPGVESLPAVLSMLTSGNPRSERIFDRRQIDYLERQAELLKKHEKSINPKNRVLAIGVLGSDVYDKLLALQIFRKRFPATLYFTTDLDAAYLHPEVSSFTKNLIIASPFGLSPLNNIDDHSIHGKADGKDHCPEISFRDSHQTALYEAIGLVLNKNRQQETNSRFHLDYHNGFVGVGGKIGLYEVGNSSFVKLRLTDKESHHFNQSSNLQEELDLDSRTDQRQETNQTEWDIRKKLETWWGMGIALALFVCLNIGLIRLFIRIRKLPENPTGNLPEIPKEPQGERNNDLWTYLKNHKPVLVLISRLFGILAGTVGIVILLPLLLNSLEVKEPMLWFEGVSAWPAIIFRIALWIFGLWWFRENIIKNQEILNRLKTLNETESKESNSDPLGIDLNRLIHKERIYENEKDVGNELVFSGILTLGLLWAMFALIFICKSFSDAYLVPTRGETAYHWHIFTLLGSLTLLMLSIWWSFLRHAECRRILNSCEKELQRDSDGTQILSSVQARWLQEYSLSASMTLFAPFAMLVLLLASRHRVFDGWNTPVVLIMNCGVLVLLLLVASLRVMQAAQAVRRTAQINGQILLEKDQGKRKQKEIDAVWVEARGPFGSLRQQPLVQALLIVLASLGIASLESITRLFGP